MPNNVIITGYFCGIYEKSEPDSDEADRLMIHVKGEKKCDVCNIIGDMNGSSDRLLYGLQFEFS